MPSIDMTFEGWAIGAKITTAKDTDGNIIDVSEMTSEDLAQMITDKKLFVKLTDVLKSCYKSSVDFFDVEAN